MRRKALIPLHKAQELYGVARTTFIRPRYVPEGSCEWCGSPLPNKRRKSCCSEECNRKFLNTTCAVMYANTGSAGGYRNHIFRRDNYTCQNCGTFHAYINENGIPVPTTDGELDLHHIKPVSQGGSDAPYNLVTWCKECHKEWHKKYGVEYWARSRKVRENMKVDYITEEIVNHIEKKIFEEWKHEGYVDGFTSDKVYAVIDGRKYDITVRELGEVETNER